MPASPFLDIRAWHRALARWSDVVEVTALAPPEDIRDLELSAVGLVTVRRLENDAFVMAKLEYAFLATPPAHAAAAFFDIDGKRAQGCDPEEVVFRIVEVARKATPPTPVFRAGTHRR